MNRFFTLCLFLGLSILAHAQQGTLRLKKIDNQFKYLDMPDYDVLILDAVMLDSKFDCQDTLREVKQLAGSFTNPSFSLKKYQTSYYNSGKRKQFILTQGTQGFAPGSTPTMKPTQRLSYSYSTIKGEPDTTLFESWDATNNNWKFSSKGLYYKNQNNRDTLNRSLNISGQEVTNARYFFATDGKDSMTIRKSSTTAQTLDSTIYTYDSQRRLTLHKQLTYNTTTKVFYIQFERKWQYDNNKLVSHYKSSYIGGTTPYYVDSSFTHTYLDNNLTVTEEKYAQRNAQTQAVTDSTHERSRYLTFNTKGKPLTIEKDEWDYTNNKWKRMANVTNEYQVDTLIKKETRTEIGIRTGIYTYDEFTIYTYESCQSLTSSANEIVQNLPFSIAPNPANSEVRINLSDDNIDPAHLTIYSLQGNLIQSKQLIDNQSSVDVSSLPRGMYLVKVQQGNSFAVKKLTLF